MSSFAQSFASSFTHSFAHSFAGIALAAPLLAFAQNPGLLAEVKAADAAYWKAYNDCDYAALDKLTAENVEFYHDIGGVTNGRAALTDSVRKNICGRPGVTVQRTVQDKDTQTYLLNRGPDVYGAIVTGRHEFSEAPKGVKAAPNGEALFSMLWLRNADKTWTLSRALSYDHKAILKPNDSKVVALADADLERFAGSYAAKIQKVLTFRRAGLNLSVEVGGRPVTLYPKGPNTFFMKERDIEVEFKAAADGKASSLVLRENGRQVDEGTRIPG
ncbi:MAG TPA: nuclear transport factor 2 family protein [Pseudoduganella sp.]